VCIKVYKLIIYIIFIVIIILDLERRFSINGVNLTSVLSPWNTMTWDNFNKLEYCLPPCFKIFNFETTTSISYILPTYL